MIENIENYFNFIIINHRNFKDIVILLGFILLITLSYYVVLNIFEKGLFKELISNKIYNIVSVIFFIIIFITIGILLIIVCGLLNIFPLYVVIVLVFIQIRTTD